jgi:hypothetical protein
MEAKRMLERVTRLDIATIHCIQQVAMVVASSPRADMNLALPDASKR